MKIFVIKASKLLILVCLAFLLSSCNRTKDSLQGVWYAVPNEYLSSSLEFTENKVYIRYSYDLGISSFCISKSDITYASDYTIDGDKIIIEKTGEVFTLTDKNEITYPFLKEQIYFLYEKK
jgi:hypothetical protein